MIRIIAFLLASMVLGSPLQAQVMPRPGEDNPRLQTVRWIAGQDVILTALPLTGLTVMLEPGEQIRRVSLDNERALDVRVSAERDSLLILPLINDATGGLLVQTDRRDYRLQVQTGTGLMAAYLVRFEFDSPEAVAPSYTQPGGQVWTYRLRGDRTVRPSEITDDGIRTRITFAADQALPAVFAIGPSGEEQVVNGYMREGVFVIDRVWPELVFRIDKEKATARRNREPENASG